MRLKRCIFWTVFLSCFIVGLSLKTSSATPLRPPTAPDITINSFLGSYSFSRQDNGTSTLTTTETISVNFPDQSNFYGINRQIPENFSGHSVDIKVLGITDEVGNPVTYKTSSNNGNEVIVTGDPSIILFGDHTYNIRYQTSDVVNLTGKSDEFLLDVNGRGWNQPINNIQARIILPSSLVSKLQASPICYISSGDPTIPNCQISSQKSSQVLKINARSLYIPAHQSLLVRINFLPSTFEHRKSHGVMLITVSVVAICGIALITFIVKKVKRNKQE